MSSIDIILLPLSQDGQEWFAKTVRDFNPVHTNDDEARRSIFGQRIVHGVHSAIRQLDAMAERGILDNIDPSTSLSIKVSFRQPNYPHDEIRLRVLSKEGLITCQAFVDELCTGTMKIKIGPQDPFSSEDRSSEPYILRDLSKMSAPDNLKIDDIEGVGNIDVSHPPEVAKSLAQRYPYIAGKIGEDRLAGFGVLSSLVGMNLPGLYSLFVAVECRFSDFSHITFKQNTFSITPTKFHRDFNYLKYIAQSPIASALIEAIKRPAPVDQPGLNDVRRQMNELGQALPNLEGKTAIVIGGSRGLGAACARMLACLGAKVTVTYRNNERLAKQLNLELGEQHSTIEYDVLSPPNVQAKRPFDHIYYFATPAIFVRKTKYFDSDLSHRFNRFYLDGFVEVDKSLSHSTSSVFFPSSIEVENTDPNTIEYRTSKLSGELVNEALQIKFPRKTYVSVRLPRLMTDQTATLQPGKNDDTIAVLLSVIQKMTA